MLRQPCGQLLGILEALRCDELTIARDCGEVPSPEKAQARETDPPFLAVADLEFTLTIAKIYCENYSLGSLLAKIDQLRDVVASDEKRRRSLELRELHHRFRELRESIEIEFRAQKFYHVPYARSGFYDGDQLFGREVDNNFATASFHITEAGNCMALSRWTAAVYHLMCVLEVGLDSLACALGLPFSQDSWNKVLDGIESSVRAIERKTHGDRWKEDKDFYSSAALELRFFKDAWRNHVAHARAIYTEEAASKVFDHVKAFMQHLV